MANQRNSEDYENPYCECEMCETMVRFNDYNQHIQNCVRERRQFFPPMFGNINSMLMPLSVPNTETQEDQENQEGEIEEGENEVENANEDQGETETDILQIIPTELSNIVQNVHNILQQGQQSESNQLPSTPLELTNILQNMLRQGQQTDSNQSLPSPFELPNILQNMLSSSNIPPEAQSISQSISSLIQLFVEAGNNLSQDNPENIQNEPLNNISHIHFDIHTFQEDPNAMQEEEQQEHQDDADMEQIPLTDFNYFERMFGGSNMESNTDSNDSMNEDHTEEEEQQEQEQEGEVERQQDDFQANFNAPSPFMNSNRRTTIRYRTASTRQHIFSPQPNINQVAQVTQTQNTIQPIDLAQLVNEPISSRMLMTLSRYFPQRSEQFNDYEFNLMLGSLMGKVDRGIRDMNTVSTLITDKSELLKDDICTICQENLGELFENNVKLRKTLCNHIFCEGCITQWLDRNVKCPVCLAELDKLRDNLSNENIKLNSDLISSLSSGDDMV
jgi:hypothetical protein